MSKLQIIRDLNHKGNKNATEFVAAIKKKASVAGVTILERFIADEKDFAYMDLSLPTIVVEPMSIEVKYYNNADKNATSKVVANICENHVPCNVLIVNRSELIGKPLANMLLDKNYTTIIAHSRTNGLQRLIDVCEIVIFATGKDMRKYNCEGKFVIDVSNDYQRERCGSYFNMSHIGKRTVDLIIDGVKV